MDSLRLHPELAIDVLVDLPELADTLAEWQQVQPQRRQGVPPRLPGVAGGRALTAPNPRRRWRVIAALLAAALLLRTVDTPTQLPDGLPLRAPAIAR
ncbi:MAG TPA: hypothetical protein VEI97_11480 [bacterium]|nr:hypothetical protein [bacterium]